MDPKLRYQNKAQRSSIIKSSYASFYAGNSQAEPLLFHTTNGSREISLSLRAEDGNLLDFELAAFVDNREAIEGLVVSAIHSANDFPAIQQDNHFAVSTPAPFNGVRVAVFERYSLIDHLDNR